MKIRTIVFLLLVSLLALIGVILYPPSIPSSPLGPPLPSSVVTSQPSFTIMGFAPYWLTKKITPTAMDSITDYAFFALLLDSNGSLRTHVNTREQEPGYTNYLKMIKDPPHSRIILTFMPENQAALESILSSNSLRQAAIRTILSFVQESSAAGVNVDFEPLGSTSASLRRNFTLFIQALNQSLSANDLALSISIYPSAASRLRLWDLTALAPYTDHFVVMTYDYHLPGDNQSGPNSPLRGAGELFEHDILKNLSEISRVVKSEQILLGIPFYGYEWDVDTTEKYTRTSERASVASLERIQELIDNQALELLWDRNSLTPYAIRRIDGQIVSQIYYENENSIKLKLDLVRSANLGGVAIWALGYEGNNPKIWTTIRSLRP